MFNLKKQNNAEVNTYSEFENFLARHNISKPKEVMRGISNMKLLDKIPENNLRQLLQSSGTNALWSMLSDIPMATLKAKICDKDGLINLVNNSLQWKDKLSAREWMNLNYKKSQNQKNFLNCICSKSTDSLSGSNEFNAETQKLPWDVLKLESCTLLTPIDRTMIKELSTNLSLCTFDNIRSIGPTHQKMVVFNKNNDPVAFMTIYPQYNCFAVSGKKNSRVESNIENEIREKLISEKILSENPYLIDNQHDFSIVNRSNDSWSDYSLNNLLRNDEKLAKTMFPDIEEKIRLYKEEQEKRKQEEERQREAELKETKDKILALINEPDTLKRMQESLIRKVSQSSSRWELQDLEFLIRDLSGNVAEIDEEESHFQRQKALFMRRMGGFFE